MAEQVPVNLTALSDGALLRRFARSRDEEAFRQLVDRHAALVLGTCRRGLHCPTDADDAFQATFLVLAKSAGEIRNQSALAAWLYGVATRVCLRMRRDATRRSTHQLMEPIAEVTDPLDELLARHDEMVADEELQALPATLRTPLVLRYLAGRSNIEVADELGISVAALEGRLKRGKQQLRMRLLRRGVTLAVVVSTLKATRVAAGDVPGQLTNAAVEVAVSASNATISSLAGDSSTSSHFALQELNAMNAALLFKPLVAAVGFVGIATAVLTAQVALSHGDSGDADNPFALNAAATEEPARNDPFTAPLTSNDKHHGTDDPIEQPAPTQESRGGTSQPAHSTTEIGTASPSPSIVDLKPRSKSEIAIESALVKPLSPLGLEFQGAPLSEVVDFLRSEYRIEIQIDTRALDDSGISPDDPVDVNLRKISLESALNIMLAQLDLDFIVANEVLLVTSAEEASTRMETRVYPQQKIKLDFLQQVVAPDSWEGQGGEGRMASAGEKLVIRQTYDVHREINNLLLQLQRDVATEPFDAKTLREAEMGTYDVPPHEARF